MEESVFTHKDTYELGAKVIAIDNAEETIINNRNLDFEKIIKQAEYKLIEARKQELERELKDL